MNVINPGYYKSEDIEVIDVIEKFGLNFHRGNALRYLIRSSMVIKQNPRDTESEIADLEKAIWYLERQIRKVSEKNYNGKSSTVASADMGNDQFYKVTINSTNKGRLNGN